MQETEEGWAFEGTNHAPPPQPERVKGLFRFQAAGPKGAADLIVQIDPVGYQDDFGIGNIRMQGQGFGQHDHG